MSHKTPVPGFLFHLKIEPSDFLSARDPVETMDSSAGEAFFKVIEGIGGEQEATDYEAGGNSKFVHKLFGVKKWGNITFTNGVTADKKLFNWMFKGGRANGSIIQLAVRADEGSPFTEVCRWNFKDAIPTAWEGPGLDSAKNEIAIEKLTIAHHGLEWVGGEPPPAPEPAPEPEPEPTPTNANVQFATNSSTVPEAAKAELDQVAEDMKNDPNKRVKIEGHTDNVGDAASNQSLSQRRADSVKQHLIGKGAPESQIASCTGYGEDQPIADNSTSSGRTQNRRTTVTDA